MHHDTMRLAATLVVARDGPAGPEVLMITRNRQIDFASGALVFPGGKATASDADPAWGAGDDAASRVAALRETFEETGLLIACAQGGGPADPAACAAVVADRLSIPQDGAALAAALAARGLRLAVEGLIPFAHWVTPQGMPKRFDTLFYLAKAPDGQTVCGDGQEAADAVWIRPADALAQGEAGARKIIFPTRLNLQWLAQAPDLAALTAAARARKIVRVEPRVVHDGGEAFLVIPADAGYATTREPLAPNMP